MFETNFAITKISSLKLEGEVMTSKFIHWPPRCLALRCAVQFIPLKFSGNLALYPALTVPCHGCFFRGFVLEKSQL